MYTWRITELLKYNIQECSQIMNFHKLNKHMQLPDQEENIARSSEAYLGPSQSLGPLK